MSLSQEDWPARISSLRSRGVALLLRLISMIAPPMMLFDVKLPRNRS